MRGAHKMDVMPVSLLTGMIYAVEGVRRTRQANSNQNQERMGSLGGGGGKGGVKQKNQKDGTLSSRKRRSTTPNQICIR